MITAKELREKYLDFFKQKGHTIISSASLIPENDPTVLFTTAGMHPLVPYLMGEQHPGGKRLTDSQKCLRTDDIDEVGDTTHHTFFEMLGNWSLGDYFKQDAIAWSWEFLTSKNWLGLDPKKLAVSVFAGDNDAPRDDEAAKIWLEVSNNELQGRIDYLPKAKNWWGPAGQTGPCGPDTEMFYWVGKTEPPESIKQGDLAESLDWVEIWNDVFMQYNKNAKGEYEPLAQKNVDTGMGLARTVAILNGVFDNYQTDIFLPIIQKIESISNKKHGDSEGLTKAIRIIADHICASSFVLAEGLEPSNVGRGYVLRRLIRRAVRYGKQLGINNSFCSEIAEVVAEIYKDVYPEVLKNIEFIKSELNKEEERFGKTLVQGLKRFEEFVLREEIRKNPKGIMRAGGVASSQGILYGNDAFLLYQSYGFPKEIMKDLCQEKSIHFEEAGFDEAYKKHQELSRTASAGIFKGGLQDHSEISTQYHTATHLLQAALRKVLGAHIYQKGSNITAERMRFDFSHSKEITQEELQTTEDLVNQKIQESLPVHFEEMTVEGAKQAGALGVFESKYGERVKVYFVGSPEDYYSIEICGGPHIQNTREIGSFKIKKCESIGQGTKRIRAVIHDGESKKN